MFVCLFFVVLRHSNSISDSEESSFSPKKISKDKFSVSAVRSFKMIVMSRNAEPMSENSATTLGLCHPRTGLFMYCFILQSTQMMQRLEMCIIIHYVIQSFHRTTQSTREVMTISQ